MGSKQALVTGGTSGIGLAIAESLVEAGFAVTVTGRDAAKGEEAAASIGARFAPVDHSDLSEVRALAASVGSVDVLVNNVGGAFWNRAETKDGHELTLALNLLAPVVLTEGMLPNLREGSRIVNIVTKLEKGMKLDLEDPHGLKKYRGFDAYAGAKVALLGWTLGLAKRAESWGILVNGVHPGIVMNTGFGADMPWIMRAMGPVIARLFGMSRSMEDAVRTPLRLATTGTETGKYLDLDAEIPLPAQLEDPAQVERILALCADLGAAPAQPA